MALRVRLFSPMASSGIDYLMQKKSSIALALMACLGLLLVACVDSKKETERRVADLYLPDLDDLFQDYEQMERRKDFDAFARKIVKANRDLQSSELYIEAASLYHQAGLQDSALIFIHKAIDHGMSNPVILKKFKGLEKSSGVLFNQLVKRLDSLDRELKNIGHFELVATSMATFWPFFDKALSDKPNATRYLKEYILDGPPEIRDYYAIRYYNPENMYGQMINGSPKYYAYLKKHFGSENLQSLKNITVASIEHFSQLYPRAVYPKVYIVPGLLNSGGTASELGLFIGADMYGKSAEMPQNELTEWQREAVMESEAIPSLILHEFMHFQQNYGDEAEKELVFYKILEEGVCDFLVELSKGVPLENEQLRYLSNPVNMVQISKELQEEFYSEDLSKWMYNGGAIEDRPADLGYALGYLIAKSFYQNSPDKGKAITQLLTTNDMRSIYLNSDYAFLLENIPSS